MSGGQRVLFVFLDGVGIGAEDAATNPLAAADIGCMREMLDGRGPFTEAGTLRARSASLAPLDATMGVAGLPQSGTGHVALLTGENAARAFGRHFGPWVPTALRPLLAERSILRRAQAAGRTVAFANAYPEEVLDRATGGADGERRDAAAPKPTLRTTARRPTPLRVGFAYAALEAGVLVRHTRALAREEALASEIVNDGWIAHLGRSEVPAITPARAGANLARIAAAHDLTVFAHYGTDHVGHRGSLADAVAAVERVDAFLGGVVDALPADVLLIVASDHGNLEDVRAGHTLNPALGLVRGPAHGEAAARLGAVTDVATEVLRQLGVE